MKSPGLHEGSQAPTQYSNNSVDEIDKERAEQGVGGNLTWEEADDVKRGETETSWRRTKEPAGQGGAFSRYSAGRPNDTADR